MANIFTKYIPNTVTCLNLFSGCIACVMAFEARYELAFIFIILSAVFDFFDGMLARLLNAHSPIGKDLDSLADDISFGAAPAFIIFSLFKEMHYPANIEFIAPYMPYAAFLIAVFSGLRLAKFNNDTRQTTSFIGLPVPANALFWGSLIVGAHDFLITPACHPVYILILVMLFSKPLILLFNDNPALMNVTVTSMHIYFQGFFMMSFQFAGQSTFTALGRSKQAVFFSLFRKVVIVIPLIYILPHIGNLGVNLSLIHI